MTLIPIPKEEIEVFKQLKNIRIIFDVGARTDTEYLDIKPKAVFHLFEPNPDFFEELKQRIFQRIVNRVWLNNYGLGDVEGEFWYQDGLQAIEGTQNIETGDRRVRIKTLDGYCQENKIKRIDFLKIDTEGYDLKVLKGGRNILKNTKYIQYEHWDNDKEFHKLLTDFVIEYIGYRNSLCINKNLVKPEDMAKIIGFIKENKYADLR